jgi:xanthine dehydrogenase accessory factor
MATSRPGSGTTIAERSAQLRASRVPFVHAKVVLAERPTSSKPGDEALVLGDGTIEGFVGGSCAASTVRETSLALLTSGESVLLRITPEPQADEPGKQVVHNACLSGGTLEIFLQPAVPATLVTVVGGSPIAEALEALGAGVGFEMVRSNGPVTAGSAAVIVAAHGHGDEHEVLTDALTAGVGYVGLIASPRRGAAVVAALDVDDDLKARVHTPAGFDIGARTAPEIALSILAEIVSERPRPAEPPPPEGDAEVARLAAGADVNGSETHEGVAHELGGTGTDPVCGMSVVREPSSLHLEHHGELVWFCGSGCKRAFAADPTSYGG